MAWKAIQHWQFHNRSIKFGENFIPKTKWQTSWTPSSVVWMYKTLEQKKLEKLSNSANSISVNSSVNLCPSVAPPASSSRPVSNEKTLTKLMFYLYARLLTLFFFTGTKYLLPQTIVADSRGDIPLYRRGPRSHRIGLCVKDVFYVTERLHYKVSRNTTSLTCICTRDKT